MRVLLIWRALCSFSFIGREPGHAMDCRGPSLIGGRSNTTGILISITRAQTANRHSQTMAKGAGVQKSRLRGIASNGRELLFGEAGHIHANTRERTLSVN